MEVGNQVPRFQGNLTSKFYNAQKWSKAKRLKYRNHRSVAIPIAETSLQTNSAATAIVRGFAKGWFPKGWFCSWTPQNQTEGTKNGATLQTTKNGTTVQKNGTRAHLPKPPFKKPPFCLLSTCLRKGTCSLPSEISFWSDSLSFCSLSLSLSIYLSINHLFSLSLLSPSICIC